VPIWKRETGADGQSWGLEAQHLVDLDDLGDLDDLDAVSGLSERTS